MGYRSPPFNIPLTGGSTSPGQGRSIREHDEQLNALRKENFNLKLRIYFMEEKSASTNSPEGADTYSKENVDLKVNSVGVCVCSNFHLKPSLIQCFHSKFIRIIRLS